MDAKAAGMDGKGALYQRILSDIRGRILSGEWPPGHRIPFEHELSVQYGCSRMTANKAMSELARTGLIERRRRSGSFVKRPQSQAAILEIHDIRAEVEALGLPYRYERLSHAVRGAAERGSRCGLPSRNRPGRTGLPAFRRRGALLPGGARDQPCRRAGSGGRSFEKTAPGPWLLSRVPVERRRAHDPRRGGRRACRGNAGRSRATAHASWCSGVPGAPTSR